MDRNVDRAFGLSLSVIVYSLFLAFISILLVTAYKYQDAKISGEGMNQSLVKTGSYDQEDEDVILYTGRTVYRTTDGDAVNVNLHGTSTTTITKMSDTELQNSGAPDSYSNKALAAGEAVTGAGVFAELLSLPSSVKRVNINGLILYNDPDLSDHDIINSHVNIAYYAALGDTVSIKEKSNVDFLKNYGKVYECDDKGQIVQIIYSAL